MRVLTSEEFSLSAAVGGVRGLVESTAPGLVFVVVFVASGQLLTPALISSAAVAVLAVVARLVQRTPITQALGGMLGVGIGIVWAWRSGEASNYFVYGLWTNAAYLIALAVSVLVRWPVVGLAVEGMKGGFGPTAPEDSSERTDDPASERGLESAHGTEPADDVASDGRDPDRVGVHVQDAQDGPASGGWSRWRDDAVLVRRYATATWVLVAMFALRLVVQVPLYLADQVGWLGTARLVMGLPLFALTLWIVWILVKPRSRVAGSR
ncbi:DUF3159 domain-containing protein [Paraoerskovia sediminicola]|nr:DUF3159 domain-containing protein [Paraoerskovia sediminicola]